MYGIPNMKPPALKAGLSSRAVRQLMPSGASVAVAVCSVDLGGVAPSEIKLTPAGHFRARDGRPSEVPTGWYIDAELAGRIIARAQLQADDFLIDYEHQTLYTKENGQPAPAAGWWSAANMQWREGDGLYATGVRWTAAAKAAIEAEEYRYLSPVLYFDPATGDVLLVVMAALVNYAAIDGLDGLAVQAAAKFDLNPREEDTVNREQLIALLGLSATATDDDIQTTLTALKARAEQVEGLTGQIAALKAAQPESGKPDPAQYVPLAQFEALKGEMAALRGDVTTREVAELVRGGLACGKLLSAQEAWATELGNKDIAALKGYLEKTPAIAALKGTQTGGQAPADKGQGGGGGKLTDAQLAICKATGIAPEDYIKANAEEAE